MNSISFDKKTINFAAYDLPYFLTILKCNLAIKSLRMCSDQVFSIFFDYKAGTTGKIFDKSLYNGMEIQEV
jgi:hypothetical protein